MSLGGRRLRPARDFQVLSYSGSGRASGRLHGIGNGCSEDEFAQLSSGELPLVNRGVCFFRVKALNAQRAGAPALVVFEDVITRRGVPSGTLAVPGIRIPVLLVSARAVRDDPEVSLEVDAVSERRETQNVIAETLGRGGGARGDGGRAPRLRGRRARHQRQRQRHRHADRAGRGDRPRSAGRARAARVLGRRGARPARLAPLRPLAQPRRATANPRVHQPRHGGIAEPGPSALLGRRRPPRARAARRGRGPAREGHRRWRVRPRSVRGGGRAGERPLHGLLGARPRRTPTRRLLPPRLRHRRQRGPPGAAADGARGRRRPCASCPLRRSRRPARARRTARAAARPRTSSIRRPA